MALVVKDRVKETTTTTGTGTVTLGGAVSGFQTFTSVLSNADTTYYAIIDYVNNDFEVGLGTFTSSGTTLARTTILESSNSGSAVDLESGTKEVFITYPAEKSVYLDASNQLVINGSAVTASATDLNLIDGITNGTVIASKAIITDSNKDISGGRNITISGELDAATLDLSGNADIDGTLEADAITVDGTALNEYIADTVGAMVSSNTETNITVTYEDSDNTLDFVIGTLNQDTTGTADNFTVSANNSTDETVYPVFVDGATGSQGAETDTGLTYNPSTGLLTSTGFSGNLTGTLQTAAQANVTSLGTLTTLTVDNVIINGSTIGHTGDTDLMTVASGVLTVAGEVDATSLDISGDADIDGTLEADAITVDGTALATYIRDTVGTNMLSSNTETGIAVTYDTTNDNIDFALDASQTVFTSITNTSLSVGRDADNQIKFDTDNEITFRVSAGDNVVFKASGEIEASSLDISGDVDIDGTLEADAITVNGTALSSVISGTTVDLATSITVSANNSTDETVYPVFVDGSTGTQGAETDTGLTYNPSSGLLTISGELDAGSLDISGNADIDGTLEADAITVDGTALNEYIADTAGAMFSSNTETGVTVTYQDGDNTIDVAVDAAQTTITSLLATDIKIGEDDQTKIDFETADEIHFYAANAEQVYVADGIFGPQTDSDVDLGSSSVRWKDAYIDSVTTTGNVTVGGNLSVTGTTTTVNTVTMEAANAIVFEGATADAYETTLSIVDPTADHTQYLINQGGYIPVLAAATTTAITSTPAELNILDGVTSTTAELNLLDGVTSTTTELNYNDTGQSVGTVVASKTVTVDSNKDVSSFRNVTLTGELDAATLDISGNADIAGDLTLSAGGDGALQFSAASSIKILDNSSASLVVEESDNAYMTFVTTNGSEAVKFDKALDLNAAVQLDSTLTIGANDTGYDVKFFGGTSGAYMLWDEDVDDLILAGAARVVVPDGQLVLGSTAVTSTAAELNIMDGVTATATELNIMDGDTSASSTTVADADRVVLNDNGTMKQVAVTDLSAYFDDEITAMPNLVTTAATTVGALDSGSITSGFGTIDTGSSTITTTGLISGGSLDIDNVLINGTTIGHTDDTDLITVADGLVTIAGEISTTTLDIGGTNVTSTAAELNILDGVTSTATELNIMDGNTSATSTTLVDADRVVANDNGTMKQVALTDIKTYLTSAGYASQDDATALAIALG